MLKKYCYVCKQKFEPTGRNQKTCSAESYLVKHRKVITC